MIAVPAEAAPPPNLSVPADGDPAAYQHRQLADRTSVSAALSMANHLPAPIATRKVAILVAGRVRWRRASPP